jgi:hypothetical protein
LKRLEKGITLEKNRWKRVNPAYHASLSNSSMQAQTGASLLLAWEETL